MLVFDVKYVLINSDCLHLEGPVCDSELWDRQVKSNILTAARLTVSFVRMTRNLTFCLSRFGLKA
jgi:hypothetical protein